MMKSDIYSDMIYIHPPYIETIMKICCIKGCEKEVEALGLCVNHWRLNRKYWSPVAYKAHNGMMRGLTPEQRFWKQVKKTDGCWIWAASIDKDGYGIFRGEISGVMFNKAHRFSHALHTGDLLIGKLAMHSCDNPRCVNPDHLLSGTPKDNMVDKVRKGRSNMPFGMKHREAILTDEQAEAILKDARPYTQIAADYNVAPSTIGSLKQRISWRHIKGDAVKAPRIGQRGEEFYAAKLNEIDVKSIRASSEKGKELALKYKVSAQTITDIRKFRSWKHI